MTTLGVPSTQAPMVTDDLWSLKADPERLMAAAKSWRGLADTARDSAADTKHGANALFNSGWSGEVADTYAGHGRNLIVDLDEFASLADRGGQAVEDLADALGRRPTAAPRGLEGVDQGGAGRTVRRPGHLHPDRCGRRHRSADRHRRR
ncbi:WXG100 family type VII secretion target [Micromonospora arida]|uniref:WXG100 family type VII secretion target n=1 Tax=Micromonospora arida TaxID=2203715 RepID=UPI0033F838AA